MDIWGKPDCSISWGLRCRWRSHFSTSSASIAGSKRQIKGFLWCSPGTKQTGASEQWCEPLRPWGPNLYSLVVLADYMVAVSGAALFSKIKDREGLESLPLCYEPVVLCLPVSPQALQLPSRWLLGLEQYSLSKQESHLFLDLLVIPLGWTAASHSSFSVFGSAMTGCPTSPVLLIEEKKMALYYPESPEEISTFVLRGL